MDWKKQVPQLPQVDLGWSVQSATPSKNVQGKKSEDELTKATQMTESFKAYLQTMNQAYAQTLLVPLPTTSKTTIPVLPVIPIIGIEDTTELQNELQDLQVLPEDSMRTESEEGAVHVRKVSFQPVFDEDNFDLDKPRKDRPRSKSLEPSAIDKISAAASEQGASLFLVGSFSGKLVDQEDLEARDKVSELKLNSSAFNSTLISSEPSASVEQSDESFQMPSPSNIGARRSSNNSDLLSVSLNSSGGFPRVTRSFAGYAKKLGPVSAPTTPGLSLLTLAAVSQGLPISNQHQKAPSTILKEPELPQKPSIPRVALSAHEISPLVADNAKTYTLDDFSVIRRVGKGGFAKVFLVRQRKSSRKYYALKCIKKSEIVRLKQEKQILNEKNILKNFKHPFIVELFHTFQTRTHLFMTLEFVPGGDLYTLMKITRGFEEEAAKFYIAEVIIALDYLHSINIVYRDLKPENILLDATGHVKLADFGFARVLTGKTRSFCGTPDYIAWEIVANKEYNHSVDWWSLGVLIFELMSGKTPFRAKTSEQIYQNIQDMNIQWLPIIRGQCLDLIQRLLVINPSFRLGSRLGAPEIKMHGWFNSINWKRLSLRQVVPPIIPNLQRPEVMEREKKESGEPVVDFDEILKAEPENLDSVVDPFKEF